MAWIGLFLGLVIGGAVGELEGAIVGGFVGWLGGFIVGNSKKSKSTDKAEPGGAMELRISMLESELRALGARVKMLEGQAIAAPGMTPSVAPEGVVAEPKVEVAPAPEPVSVVAKVEEPALPEEPPKPQEPSKPNPIVAWFFGGNTIARVGLLVLFVGLAFLIKYAADHSIFPPEARVAIVAAFGIGLLGLGAWLRNRRRAYALGLQGAGVATLYLATFGALRLYSLIPPEAAFVMLALIAVFSGVLAVTQDALALAVLGAGGGFLAPILASTGTGSHVALFGFYLLLNLGIVGIALFKAWRVLNLVGFAFTFLIGTAWGVTSYRPEYFATTEPFLVAFFLLYLAVAVLYARRQVPELNHFVDGTIVFGTPLAAAGLQAALMRDMDFGLAFSALAAGALYLGLATMLKRRKPARWGLLAESFLSLGVVFASLAIPFALDARWTSAGWALEGAAVYWAGVRQQRRLARAFALLLQVGAAVAYLDAFMRFPSETPIANAAFLGALMLAVAGIAISRILANAGERVRASERGLAPLLFWWGLAWWLVAWIHEISTFAGSRSEVAATVALFALTGAAAAWLAAKRGWTTAAVAARLMLPVLVLLLLGALFDTPAHPMAGWGALTWPLAVAAQFSVLWRLERDVPGTRATWLHAGTSLWLAALLGVELNWLAAEYTAHGTAWSIAAAAFPAVVMLAATTSQPVASRWPVAAQPHAWRVAAAGGFVLALVAWSIFANATHDGRSDPLPYLPLLNALDLVHAMAIVAIALAWRDSMRVDGKGFADPPVRWAAIVGGVAFIWLTSALLRTLHHWAGVPYTLYGIEHSFLAQASLSVFWSTLALALMVFSTRRAKRPLWMVGAALMAVVVAKLFLVDLSHVGGLARIASFIVVGLLMLLIGYLSPVPPKAEEAA